MKTNSIKHEMLFELVAGLTYRVETTFDVLFQSLLYRPKWPMGPALNSGFISMKRLGVLLLLTGWDASPSQGYPQHICWYPEEKHCKSKLSCLRSQHNDHGQGSNPDHSIRSRAH